jgi:MFS transporter, PAT family, beta-lactamase induction signal transducer AmpG
VFMLWVAGGPDNRAEGQSAHKTAHYALCTGFMALGMMLPGMVAGWLQEQLGYTRFFAWCCLATLPGFAAAAWARIPRDFGKEAAPPPG